MLPRLLHIGLAALLFVSSAGANVSTHFCGGVAVEWSVYLVAEDCGMGGRDLAKRSRPADEPTMERVPCCEDEFSYVQLDVDQQDSDTLSDWLPGVAAFAKTAPPYPTRATAPDADALPRLRARPPPDPLPQRARLAALRARLI